MLIIYENDTRYEIKDNHLKGNFIVGNQQQLDNEKSEG